MNTTFTFLPGVAILAMAAMVAAPANAMTSIYTTTLSGAAEATPNGSLGSGSAVVTVDRDLRTLSISTSFAGLTGDTTQSHIHCCTAFPATTAGVATETPTFGGFPLGVKFGTYTNTFNMTLASSYNSAFIVNNGGTTTTAFTALLAGLDTGKAYVNIHTSSFGGGEIRGFLAPVPEPETYALMLAGLGAVAWAARRRSV